MRTIFFIAILWIFCSCINMRNVHEPLIRAWVEFEYSMLVYTNKKCQKHRHKFAHINLHITIYHIINNNIIFFCVRIRARARPLVRLLVFMCVFCFVVHPKWYSYYNCVMQANGLPKSIVQNVDNDSDICVR